MGYGLQWSNRTSRSSEYFSSPMDVDMVKFFNNVDVWAPHTNSRTAFICFSSDIPNRFEAVIQTFSKFVPINSVGVDIIDATVQCHHGLYRKITGKNRRIPQTELRRGQLKFSPKVECRRHVLISGCDNHTRLCNMSWRFGEDVVDSLNHSHYWCIECSCWEGGESRNSIMEFHQYIEATGIAEDRDVGRNGR